MHLMVSLPNLIAQCTVMDFFKEVLQMLYKMYVCVYVCVNTAYNEYISQTNVNYAHLNHFQNKLDLKLSVQGNLDRGN
jgi:hypothetical protein